MIKFLDGIRKYGALTAFRILDEDNSFNISFDEYYEKVEKCAYNLKNLFGDIKGKTVGIYCDSSYDYTVIIAALVFGRAVAVPMNIHESLDNIKYQIEDSEMEILITDSARESIGNELTGVKLVGKDSLLVETIEKIELADFLDEEKDNTAMMVYTSGTTGKAKGVLVTAGNLFGNAKSLYDSSAPFDKFEGLKIYTNFPYYHIGGLTSWVTHFEKGCTTYLSVNPGNVLTDLEHESIDSAVVTPATLKLWEKSVNRGRIDRLGGLKLVVTAGAPVDVNTVDTFMKEGIGYGQYYGMTESCGNITSNFDCINHLKSVGRPDPMVEVEIIDGEICVKSPGVMKGYFKNEEETRASLEGGVLHTGDLGYIDDEGYVYITGRKKNLIILSGGENVSPEELEKLMYANSDVKECKAFAKNDRIFMAVYSDEAARESIQSYVSELNKTLPIFKRIYGIEFQNEEFEKTASGKIKR